jgi:predicted aspartyl protease
MISVAKNGELRGTRRGYRPKLLVGPLVLMAAAVALGYGHLPNWPSALGSSASMQIEATSVHSAIPFRSAANGMYVYVGLGGVPHNMLVDTGASISTVTLPIARVLIARRQAVVLPGFMQIGMADGSVTVRQTIGVRTVTVGPYVIHNVQMVVTDDGADLLLGLPVLKTIGSFTIDQSHQQIRFN